jgi:hypothetical protein
MKTIVNAYYNKIDLDINGFMLGSRLSGKTNTLNLFVLEAATLFNNLGIKTTINILRYEVNQAQEYFDELNTIAHEAEFVVSKINMKDRKLIIGNVEIRVRGFRSGSKKKEEKLGIKRHSNLDVMLTIIDEIYEFPSESYLHQFRESIGVSKINVEIQACNPWNSYHWAIKKQIDYLNISIKTLEKKLANDDIGQHFQSSVELIKDKKDNHKKLTKLRFLHWGNWRINEYITLSSKQKLLAMQEQDPQRARVVDLGLPGIEKGAIYLHALTYMPNKLWDDFFDTEVYSIIGIDVGYTRDATAYILRMRNKDGKDYIAYEFYYNPDKQEFFLNGIREEFKFINITEKARAVEGWLLECMKDIKLQQINQSQFDIYIDNADTDLRDMVNELKTNKNLITAMAADKPRIQRRISAIKFQLITNRLFIDKIKCPKLWEELNQSMWEEGLDKSSSNKEAKRMDGKDHSINAMEYTYTINDINNILRRDALWDD